MKRFLILSIVLLSSIITYAGDKTATIIKVWIEHGVTINNQDAMKVHCNFTVQGMKGLSGSMGIWVMNSSGDWHRVNGNATSSAGIKYFSWSFKPGYDDATYSDYWYAPYISQLNLSPGKNDYKVVVCIIDDNGKILAQSSPVGFSGTGHQNSYNSSQQQANNSNSPVKEWREELPGGFVLVKQYANGSQFRTRYRICPNCRGALSCPTCHGTGRCSICGGNGGIITPGYGNYLPCALCSATGVCSLCKGSGKCMCVSFGYPGYVIGSSSTIMADGSVFSDHADYNNSSSSSSSSSSSRSSSTKKYCSTCGGTGVSPTPNSGGGLQSWIAYYNSSGTKCTYCGRYTAHYHNRCESCNAPSH